MTDRELLELAATAAGYGLPGPDDHDEIGRQELDGLWVKFPWGWDWWRPLANDGDALRLAVRLGLFFKPEFFSFLSLERFAGQEHDDCRATRRAIVRAAAEIGKETK